MQLEEPAEAFTHLGGLEAGIRLVAEHLDRVLRPAPPVAALVALGLAERPEPLLHSPATLGHEPDSASTLARVAVSPRVLEYDVTVDRDRTARSGRGGSANPAEEAWTAEHLVLAGLVRCTLSSLDYSAERAGLAVVASGQANGTVTRRDDDGRYAFVRIDVHFELELDPATDLVAMKELVVRAEKGCFVGNSLIARPGYHWTVNGEQIA